MSKYSKTLSLSSDIQQLSEVEGLIDNLLNEGLIPMEHYGNVLIAITEAFLNAVNHGNKRDASKTAIVEFDITDETLSVNVKDQGIGFDYKNLPDPTDPKNLEKVNGRGLYIIKNLTDKLEFKDNGSLLKMEFNIAVKELVEA